MTMADDQNCCTKKRAQQCESKWSELPIEIAELILEKLASIDILRFKAVCSSWKYAANSYIAAPYYKPLPQSPWLVLGNGQEDNSCRFFSLEEKKVYTIKNILFEGCCVSSSHGWLVIMNKDSILNLFNPVSGESIQLSDIRALDGFSSFSGSEILKAVLSSEPSGRNNFFLTICIRQTSRSMRSDNLAVYNHGGKTWNPLLASSREIVFHNSKLFALLGKNAVQVWDFKKSCGDRTTVYIFRRKLRNQSLTRTYMVKYSRLVESLGEILRVTLVLVNSLDDSSHKESYFEVYKMNLRPTTSRGTWEKVESLGHRFIIWCRNRASIALSASYFTEFEENSIYCYHRRRIFVYNLKDKVVKPCYRFDESTTNQEPFWIVPNLSLK
ncbi:F-box protein At2g05970-like [Rosa rugosa]|uniref:F-box protein At2g05970-like n=1 Tax=Rosa rugosa TaxID=74645 RepID=UPI002B4081EC|nr:F-box protein At2g05970-like [Rosa rugosa]